MYSKPITAATLGSSPAIINLNNTLQSAIEGSSGTSTDSNTCPHLRANNVTDILYLYPVLCLIGRGRFSVSTFLVDVELSKLDERLVQILAWQRLQQLLPHTKTTTSPTNNVLPGQQKNNSNPTTTQQQQQQQQPQLDKKPLTSVAPTQPAYTSKLSSSPRALIGSLNTTASIDIISTARKTNVCVFSSAQDIRARALLCPLTGKGTPVSMHCRSLNIGTGET